MEILFLGTGSAWCIPEHSCACAICRRLREEGEERTRTSLLISGSETLMVDCGPDARQQLIRHGVQRPDAVLITHEHGDHFLGMDDLLPFRRSLPPQDWQPIPVYATEQAWEAIQVRFGYLLGSMVERRTAVPGRPLEGIETRVTPFKTFHGPSAPGSVGYVIEATQGEAKPFKLVYTSDFMRLEEEPSVLLEPDVLIIQSHWLNEPEQNRPHHLSFQRAIDYILRWKPKRAVYLVHISDGDQVPGDTCNDFLKKFRPLSPLSEPKSGKPYPVPTCQEEWQSVVDKICKEYAIAVPIRVAYDGLRIDLQ